MYEIKFRNPAKKFLKKLDNHTKKIIIKKIEQLQFDSKLGKPLSGTLSGLWRLRVDKYRVIYQIQNNKLIIFVLNIGYRKNIYN
jgi:mRNA interferase RelE/StbE